VNKDMSGANASPIGRSNIVMTVLIFIIVLLSSPLAFSQAQPPAPKPPEETPLSPLAVPKEYHYNGRGRRDPFVNPIPKPAVNAPNAVAGLRPPDCPQSQGLKGVLIGQASIAGVVTSREPSMNVAIISAPGGKTYFAHIGDSLCDGVVKSIKLDVVTFMPNVPSGADQKSIREVERKVRPTP
jgi:Tfp pilus assembly protein PilP